MTDRQHHIEAISSAQPGAGHGKALCDQVRTLDRLLDGCEADADKGYQGLAAHVSLVSVRDPQTGAISQVPRLTVQIPFKKPKGGELSDEQRAFVKSPAAPCCQPGMCGLTNGLRVQLSTD